MKRNILITAGIHLFAIVAVNGFPLGHEEGLLPRGFEFDFIGHGALYARAANPVVETMHSFGGGQPRAPQTYSYPGIPGAFQDPFLGGQDDVTLRPYRPNAAAPLRVIGSSRGTAGQTSLLEDPTVKTSLYRRAAKDSISVNLNSIGGQMRRNVIPTQPLIRNIAVRELMKRHLQAKRNQEQFVVHGQAPMPAAPLVPEDPCAGKHGLRHKMCRAENKIRKPAEHVGNFAKHHAGEIALNVGLAVGGVALEAVTFGGATPAIAAAEVGLNVATKAGTVAKLGEGALEAERAAKAAKGAEELAHGAHSAEEAGKAAQGMEKVSEGAEGVGKASKGTAEVGEEAGKAEEAGQTAKAAAEGSGKADSVEEAGVAAEKENQASSRAGKYLSKAKDRASKAGNMLLQQTKEQTYNQFSNQLNSVGGSTAYQPKPKPGAGFGSSYGSAYH